MGKNKKFDSYFDVIKNSWRKTQAFSSDWLKLEKDSLKIYDVISTTFLLEVTDNSDWLKIKEIFEYLLNI